MDSDSIMDPPGLLKAHDKTASPSIGAEALQDCLAPPTHPRQVLHLQLHGLTTFIRLSMQDFNQMCKPRLLYLGMMNIKDSLVLQMALGMYGALSITHMDPRWARRLVRQLLEQLLE